MVTRDRPGPCPLDPLTYNLSTAFVHPVTDEWVAVHHGVGGVIPLSQCPIKCEACAEGLSWEASIGYFLGADGGVEYRPKVVEPPAPAPPKVVDVGPVREHVLVLLEVVSRSELAAAAGIDKTTITRLLRADVRQVRAATADALLAVPVPADRRLRAV